MKALFLHVNRFEGKVQSSSERLDNVEPDDVTVEENFGVFVEEMEECLVILFQVEAGDGDKAIRRICNDAKKIAETTGTKRILLGAFGHLSDKWPESPQISKEISWRVIETCRGFNDYEVKASPFGHNKTLLLDVKGHQKAIKHRSY